MIQRSKWSESPLAMWTHHLPRALARHISSKMLAWPHQRFPLSLPFSRVENPHQQTHLERIPLQNFYTRYYTHSLLLHWNYMRTSLGFVLCGYYISTILPDWGLWFKWPDVSNTNSFSQCGFYSVILLGDWPDHINQVFYHHQVNLTTQCQYLSLAWDDCKKTASRW